MRIKIQGTLSQGLAASFYTMSNGTAAQEEVSSLNLGGGLIEIAAWTALIGSTREESLVLGNKGAAGLVWGTMSVFGALSVIR